MCPLGSVWKLSWNRMYFAVSVFHILTCPGSHSKWSLWGWCREACHNSKALEDWTYAVRKEWKQKEKVNSTMFYLMPTTTTWFEEGKLLEAQHDTWSTWHLNLNKLSPRQSQQSAIYNHLPFDHSSSQGLSWLNRCCSQTLQTAWYSICRLEMFFCCTARHCQTSAAYHHKTAIVGVKMDHTLNKAHH